MAMIATVFLTVLAIAVAVAAVIWSNKAVKDGEARSSREGSWSGKPNVCPRIEDAYDGVYDTVPRRSGLVSSLLGSERSPEEG